jgi:hypothetical protein
VRHFNGDLTSQHLVVSLVDGCESTSSELIGDKVSTQGERLECSRNELGRFRRKGFTFEILGMHPARCSVRGSSFLEVLRHGWCLKVAGGTSMIKGALSHNAKPMSKEKKKK